MRTLLRTVLVAATVLAPLSVPTAAHAGQNSVTVAGSATIYPGVPCYSGCAVQAAFTAVFAGSDVAGTASCFYNGVEYGTEVAGSGGGTVDCDGGFVTGSVSFARTGTAVSLTGGVEVAGTAMDLTLGLVLVPTTGPPVQSAAFTGTGTVSTRLIVHPPDVHQASLTFLGTGVVYPGNPCPGWPCDVYESLTVVMAGAHNDLLDHCDFAGRETFPGTELQQEWVGDLWCSSGMTGSLIFNRIGAVIVVGGSVTYAGDTGSVTAIGLHLPTSLLPTTSFLTVGSGLVSF
jgi:hypothetical protein